MSEFDDLAKSYWDEQPHPMAPKVKIKDFATAVKLATKTKFGGHASAPEAEMFWQEFQQLGMAPQEYEHLLDDLAKVSFALHGRPPSMNEIAKLKDAHPKDVRSYFSELPDRHYPDTTAGQMVAALRTAAPHSQEHLGRPPVKLEAAYLIHSREPAATYYARLKGSGPQAPAPSDTGGRGVAPPGGSQANQ